MEKGKAPQMPKSMMGDTQYATAFEKANSISHRQKFGISAQIKQSEETQERIYKLFDQIEDKTSQIQLQKKAQPFQSESVVSGSIQRSVFGKFSENYKAYQKMSEKSETIEIWKNYFIESKIMTDTQRCLLYFNLPMEIIKAEKKPILFFDRDLKNVAAKGSNFLHDLLDQFKDDQYENTRLANLILLQIPNSQQDIQKAGADGPLEDFQIIGGYASHAWVGSKDQLGGGGNESCFLFNLTQNLRFNAVANRSPYLSTDAHHESGNKSNKRISFGKEALTIENDFKKVASKIVMTEQAQFVFGDDLTQKNKVDSVVPGKSLDMESPAYVEVWTF